MKRTKARRKSKSKAVAKVVPALTLWSMKRRAQKRDHAMMASGEMPPEAMLLVRPHHFEGARIEWPKISLSDGPPLKLERYRVIKTSDPSSPGQFSYIIVDTHTTHRDGSFAYFAECNTQKNARHVAAALNAYEKSKSRN